MLICHVLDFALLVELRWPVNVVFLENEVFPVGDYLIFNHVTCIWNFAHVVTVSIGGGGDLCGVACEWPPRASFQLPTDSPVKT